MLISYKKPKGRFFIVGKPGGSAVTRHISIYVSGGHGSLLVNGNVVTLNENNTYEGDFPDGTQIELETVASTGYNFEGWYDGSEDLWPGGWNYDNPTTFTLDADYSLELHFVEMFNVVVQTSLDPSYGYITVNGEPGNFSGEVSDGSQLELQGVGDNQTGDGRCISFSSWTDNNGGHYYDNPITYTIDSDITINCNFYIGHFTEFIVDPTKYSIVRGGQTMTQTFTDTFIAGSCEQYEVVCETGYQFDGWLVDGVLDSNTNNPRTFCDNGADRTVEPSVSAVAPAQPNDEIWYTSTNGQVVTPFSADFGTGVTVASNTYADGKGVIKLSGNATTIGNNAFNSCTTLETINIPSSVTSIGNQSFRSCSGLTTIDIPNSIISIGYQTFQDCIGLTSITIGSGLTAIGHYDFSGCTGLISVNIPNTITEIGRQTFWNCTSLTSVTFGTGLTKLIYGSFEGCTSLTTIDIPDNVTFIGHFTFSGCSGLTSVTIGDSVTSIGDSAFYNCTSLTSVTIPSSVTSIGDSAFSGNSGLTSVTCEATTPPSLGTRVFTNTNDCPIYVPAESVTAYKGARRWSAYSSRIQAIP